MSHISQVIFSEQGRTSLSEVTIFKSLGMAVEDITAAAMVYERARVEGLGADVSI